MSDAGDFQGDMPRFPFDDSDADAVFGGSSGPHVVPEDLRDVADLVAAARRAGSADELVGEDVIVAQIAAAVGEHVLSLESGTHERTPVLSKLRTAKLAVASTAILVLGATAAAAATGALPSPSHGEARLTVAHAASATLPTVEPQPSDVHDVAHEWRHHKHMKHGLVGTVASINGVSDPNTCGTAGGSGSFTITARHTTFIVNIDTSTTYADKDQSVTDPSFANVCVGGTVAVKGSAVDTTVTASKVVVIPPPVRTGAFGTVASVNGVSDPNTCGTADTTGSFTLTGRDSQTFTVNVDTTTAYKDKDESVTGPSFANVCVGDFVAAKGSVTGEIVAATDVFIAPPKSDDTGDQSGHEKHHVLGTVASVNGVTDPNTCGTAGATGSFTLTTWNGGETFTVNVDSSTQFFVPGQSDASFADICVGAKVGAKGDVTDTTVAATSVFAFPKFGLDSHEGGHHGNCDKSSDPNAQPASFSGDDHGSWKHDGNGGGVQIVAANGDSGSHSGGDWHHGYGK